jgi:hypothetical protein
MRIKKAIKTLTSLDGVSLEHNSSFVSFLFRKEYIKDEILRQQEMILFDYTLIFVYYFTITTRYGGN